MITHQLETCARFCRYPAWLPAPAAPTTHSQGFERAQGEHQWARAQGNRRVTQLSPNFLFLNCLPACLAPPSPAAGQGRGLSAALAWVLEAGYPPPPLSPVRAGVPRRWVGSRGEPQHPRPHPNSFLWNQLPKRNGASHGYTGRDAWGHTSHVYPQIHRYSDALMNMQWYGGTHTVTWGTRKHLDPHGVLVND